MSKTVGVTVLVGWIFKQGERVGLWSFDSDVCSTKEIHINRICAKFGWEKRDDPKIHRLMVDSCAETC